MRSGAPSTASDATEPANMPNSKSRSAAMRAETASGTEAGCTHALPARIARNRVRRELQRDGMSSSLWAAFGRRSAREREAERPELSKLAIGRRRAQFLHAAMVVPRDQLFEARHHLRGIELHRSERLRHREETCLTHHDQVAKAARVLIKRLDLLEDLVGRAGE